MSVTKQHAQSPFSPQQIVEVVNQSTRGILSQSLLGNSRLTEMVIGTAGSITGQEESCEEYSGDSWLENFVEGAFGWMGIGNDSECKETPPPTPTPTPQAPPIDLSQYIWLVGVYVSSGALEAAGAEELLGLASAEQLARTLTPDPSSYTPPADPAVPAADIAADDNNRARPLDWSAAPAGGHITPETSDTAAGGGGALSAVFDAHLADMMIEEFGVGVTLDQVRGAIQLAADLERTEVVAQLQARLHRASQYAAVETLNVEDSGRYTPGAIDTFCNIYAYDLLTALGAHIPRTWWYDAAIRRIQAGEIPITTDEAQARRDRGESLSGYIYPQYAETVRELNANSLNSWMQQWGPSFGWSRAASMTAAQDAANAGSAVALLGANIRSSEPGHISVVLAEKGDLTAARNAAGEVIAPLQSQAGGVNFKHDNNSSGEGSAQWWEDATHTEGDAWINAGSATSPIITPDTLGR